MLVRPDSRAKRARRANAARYTEIRRALVARCAELRAEHANAVAGMEQVGIGDAGDDVADRGTKAFTREQELALAVTIRGQMDQAEHALERLEAGEYGWCETCSEEIPVARLTAFPAATLCVTCKSAAERR
jgi:DnaK suppressor protein